MHGPNYHLLFLMILLRNLDTYLLFDEHWIYIVVNTVHASWKVDHLLVPYMHNASGQAAHTLADC